MDQLQPDDRAYGRDASWYDYPDVHSVKKLHIPRDQDDVGHPKCSNNVLLDEGTSMAITEVPPGMRCQRSGCRQGWPEPREKRSN